MSHMRPLGLLLVLILLLPSALPTDATAAPVPLLQSGGTGHPALGTDGRQNDIPRNSSQIDAFMAGLSDEQVRRLLMAELRKNLEALDKTDKASQPSGRLRAFIQGIRDKISRFKSRLEVLRLGQPLQWEQEPNLFNYLGQDAPDGRGGPAIAHVSVLILLGLLVQWAYRRYTAATRSKIETAVPAGIWTRLAGLSMRAVLDLGGTVIFAVVVLAGYSLAGHRTGSQTVLMATYLAAIVIVQAVFVLLHFVLAPGQAALRFFPVDDALARYLHRWIGAITVIASFGFLTCGLFHVAGTSEGLHMTMVGAVGLALMLMALTMILQNRQAVATALCADLTPDGVVHRIASHWHHFAIFFLALTYLSGMVLAIMGSTLRHPGLKTVIAIAFYFPIDWTLRRMLGALIHLVGPEAHDGRSEHSHSAPEAPRENDEEGRPAFIDTAKVHRIQHVILTGLRVALAALFLVWIIGFWGIKLPYAMIAARAVFNILIVTCLCYVAWELLSAAIQKRLEAELPEMDEEMEEGGAGGSRLGTLLLLLRKFVLTIIVIMATLIILSTIGVDIGPLIAGAGVVGLAIGFGAQTLVKDIISGLFFLIDDAFRVGDYIDVGGVLGTVERISIRSMSLRHPRGMVHTIPFGDISNVTNYSRDYIITKLDFRVRYDTDVERVRKVIKKRVYKPILANEELAPKLLGKIKSQGVRRLDDSAMIMRVKYKTIPGEQFVIRKEVYRLMKEAFQEEGIEFAHRNVTVYMPGEENRSRDGQAVADADAKAAAAQAGAAAALSVDKGTT